MASLRELQRSFAAALRDPGWPVRCCRPANLAIYRNNAQHHVSRSAGADFPGGAPARRRRLFPPALRPLPPALSFAQWRPALGRVATSPAFSRLISRHRLRLARRSRASRVGAATCLLTSESPALGVEALGELCTGRLERLVFGLQPLAATARFRISRCSPCGSPIRPIMPHPWINL